MESPFKQGEKVLIEFEVVKNCDLLVDTNLFKSLFQDHIYDDILKVSRVS